MLDISLFAVLSFHYDFGRFPSAIIAASIFADPKNPTILPDVQGRGAVADRAASSSAAGPRGGGTTFSRTGESVHVRPSIPPLPHGEEVGSLEELLDQGESLLQASLCSGLKGPPGRDPSPNLRALGLARGISQREPDAHRPPLHPAECVRSGSGLNACSVSSCSDFL